MIWIKFLILVTLMGQTEICLAQTDESPLNLRTDKDLDAGHHYSLPVKPHSFSQTAGHVAALYGVSWGLYYASQPTVIKEKGSWKNFKHNLGRVVFDKDEPFWNWMVHPISGSQLYLYYRANGYDKINSVQLAFLSSTLFEFLVEIYTEPASIQDLYQTPLLGSALGLMLEKISLTLLNTQSTPLMILGHILNPSTMFWFYEGKVRVEPHVERGKMRGLQVRVEF